MEMISSPENSSDGMKEAVKELKQGWELAKQLENILSSRVNFDSAEDLLVRISNSFTKAVSVISNDTCQSPVTTRGPRNKSEDSEGSSKSTATPLTTKDGRGCYQRKKSTHSWTKDTLNWVDDGHAWRKYGQKVILKAKYPRSYFRCTYKSKGCQATKHVQQIRDDPPVYRITYYANHTCHDLLKPREVILENSAPDSSVFLSFDNNIQANEQDNPFFSSLFSLKQEHKCDLTHNQSQPSDYVLSTDHLSASGSSVPANVISCTQNFEFDDDALRQYYGF